MELQQELNWNALKQASAPTPDGVEVPAALSQHEVLLQLCDDLHKAGIYLSLARAAP